MFAVGHERANGSTWAYATHACPSYVDTDEACARMSRHMARTGADKTILALPGWLCKGILEPRGSKKMPSVIEPASSYRCWYDTLPLSQERKGRKMSAVESSHNLLQR